MPTFESKFERGQRVCVDGDRTIVCIVIGYQWRNGNDVQIEVSWFHNGSFLSAYIDEWRLSPHD